MEEIILGFLNIIKWLLVAIIVMGAIWSGVGQVFLFLVFPAIIEGFNFIYFFNRHITRE